MPTASISISLAVVVDASRHGFSKIIGIRERRPPTKTTVLYSGKIMLLEERTGKQAFPDILSQKCCFLPGVKGELLFLPILESIFNGEG